ncbi:hypothetical protein ACIQNK_12390 [Streptomyces sp. NPDC091273]|uniref:hypothetical protein n=1 Tax=Streptomyces sp. NPDC091273 TaxID=3365982 RepID=UPI003805AFAB
MGKRERRRRRERAANEQPGKIEHENEQEAAAEHLYPSPESPLLRVVITPGTAAEIRSLCAAYWALGEDGAWSYNVSDLGLTSWVTASVRRGCQAFAVHPMCAEEEPVASRTQWSVPGPRSCSRCRDLESQQEVPTPRDPADKPAVDESRDAAGPAPGSTVLPLIVEPRQAPDALIAIGMDYWRLASDDFSEGRVHWAQAVKSINVTGWGPAHIAAAAGARAVVRGRACSACHNELVLTSRTAYEGACAGLDSTCVECTLGLTAKIARMTDPNRLKQRQTDNEQAEARQKTQENTSRVASAWNQQQQRAIADHHGMCLDPQGQIPAAGVRECVAALSVLRYAPETTPISPIRTWAQNPHPEPDEGGEAVAAAVRAGLLYIHPSSPPHAFDWDPPTLAQALEDARGDLDALPTPQLTDLYHPREAYHYVPYGTSMDAAAARLDEHLSKRLRADRLTVEDQKQLLDLTRELIAAEAVRYFDYQLELRHLPPVPDNHVARLKEAADRAAATYPLGVLNNFAWLGAVRAADAAQKNPRAPRANMTTHGVNIFENKVEEALRAPTRTTKPYEHDHLASMTRTVFFTILESNPFTTGLPEARSHLQRATPADTKPADGLESTYELDPTMLAADIRWLREHQSRWAPQDFIQHLAVLAALRHLPGATGDDRAIADAARALQQIRADNDSIMSDGREAVLATCAAAELMDAVATRRSITGQVGQWVVADFVYRAMDPPAHP